MTIDFSRFVDPACAPDENPSRFTEAQAADAIVAAQKVSGDPIDPAGARRLLRALIAIGVFKPRDPG